jgi:hypothetical protein
VIITGDLSFLKRDHERDFANISGRPTLLKLSWLFLSISGLKKVTNGHKKFMETLNA